MRNCAACTHKMADECRHPQAIHLWGRIAGLENVLPAKGWPRWPVVADTDWCGWWKPGALLKARTQGE
jgi:hypothetical protein